MPVRVGIDLTSAAEVQDAVRTHAERYLERVYTPGELERCRRGAAYDATRLAGCFAAKEAALKTLRPGPARPVPWQCIETEPGRVRLSGAAAELAADQGISAIDVSITQRRGLAAAIALADHATAEKDHSPS